MAATAVALAAPAGAPAAMSQVADATTLPPVGSGVPKGSGYVRLNTYLAGRFPDSPLPMRQGNPSARVVMTFPAGGIITPTKTGLPVCDQPAGQGQAIIDRCSRSLLGDGWALVNTGQPLGPGGTPHVRPQLDGSPPPCLAEPGPFNDWLQYARVSTGGVLDCVPRGHLWNRVRVYLGGIPEGRTKKDPNAILFVSQNQASIVSFAGTTTRNVLTVPLPALYGSGSYRGELQFGWVLSDFYVRITNPRYLKAGPCPTSRKWSLRTTFTYSPRKDHDGLMWDQSLNGGKGANRPITPADIAKGTKAESVMAVPPARTVTDTDPCAR